MGLEGYSKVGSFEEMAAQEEAKGENTEAVAETTEEVTTDAGGVSEEVTEDEPKAE